MIELLDLAGADAVTRARIGDMIVAAKRGAPLPAVEDVRRRLALGTDPGSPGVTFGEAWAEWLAGKKRLRRSSRERIEQIGDHWLLPVLADVPVERLNGANIAAVFDRIEQINAAITGQQGQGRAYVHVPGDVRSRPRQVPVCGKRVKVVQGGNHSTRSANHHTPDRTSPSSAGTGRRPARGSHQRRHRRSHIVASIASHTTELAPSDARWNILRWNRPPGKRPRRRLPHTYH